jgi:tetratricopeptide (TPR) repeat protein
MQTEQPTNGSPVIARQHKSQAALQKQIRLLCRAADERCAQGQYGEAEQLYLRALALAEGHCGPDQPIVAVICNNLAVLYNLAVLCKARGRYAEAEALYRRALAIFEQAFGPEHPKVITCRNNYAGLMRNQRALLL